MPGEQLAEDPLAGPRRDRPDERHMTDGLGAAPGRWRSLPRARRRQARPGGGRRRASRAPSEVSARSTSSIWRSSGAPSPG